MMIRADELPKRFALPRAADEDRRPELPPELAYHGQRFGTFGVPTEIVIWKTGVYAPTQARFWEVDLVLYCGMYLPYRQAVGRPLYEHDGTHCYAVVVETWQDDGDDGHVEYVLDGYILLPSRSIHGDGGILHEDLFDVVKKIDDDARRRDEA